MDGFKVTTNPTCHSIVNSITNDEDDWVASGKGNGPSVVNSVSADDDELIEPTDRGRNVAASIQHLPYNHQLGFSNHGTPINGAEQMPSKPSSSRCERKPLENKYCDRELFLNRYEEMMIEQEKEQIRTIAYLQIFYDMLIDLQSDGQDGAHTHQRVDETKDSCLLMEFSIANLKQAQKKLKKPEKYDFIKMDKQFMMVLDILCDDADCSAEKKISWAEVIQCYRNCVVGMQTLEMIGPHTSIRARTKERTLALLSAYRQSSFVNYSPSIQVTSGTEAKEDLTDSKKTKDRSLDNSSRAGQLSHQRMKGRALINHPFLSLFAGAIAVAILLYGCSSTTQSTTQNQHSPLVRQQPDFKCPVGAEEAFSSEAREFKMVEETIGDNSSEKSVAMMINSSLDKVYTVPTDGDPSPFKRKGLHRTKDDNVASIVKAALPFYH